MTSVTEQLGPASAPPRQGRRLRRWLVPAGTAAAVVAGVVGVVLLTRNDPSPSLPEVSPAQLVASASQARTDTLSGSVRITTDLRVPGLGSAGVAVVDKINGTRTGEVAVDGPRRQRLSLTDHGTTYQVFHDGRTLWTYDTASRTATRSTVPEEWMDEAEWREHVLSPQAYQPQELAQRLLAELAGQATVTVDGTAKVAGRSVYVLRLVPTDRAASLVVDRVLVSVDAKTNVPLRVQVYQSNRSWPAVDALFTKVSFDQPAASTFAFTPPAGATVRQSGVDDNVSAFTRRLGEGVLGSLTGLDGSGPR